MNSPQVQPEDARQHTRWHTEHLEIHAINSVTHESMGKVANISETGVMLIGSLNVEVEHLYQAELICQKAYQSYRITIGLDCLWVNDTENKETGIVWAGFRIIDISDRDQVQLETLFTLI